MEIKIIDVTLEDMNLWKRLRESIYINNLKNINIDIIKLLFDK